MYVFFFFEAFIPRLLHVCKIYVYMYHQFKLNVNKYTIHGTSGIVAAVPVISLRDSMFFLPQCFISVRCEEAEEKKLKKTLQRSMETSP